MRIVLVFAVLSSSACASTMVDRLISGDLRPERSFCAMAQPLGGPTLDDMLAPFAETMADKTGVHVLEDGAGAMVARAWLGEKATRSIEVQYFIFSADNVGLIAADLLLRAAERGVKVRIIVDDLLVDTDADFLQALDAHPNLEIRIYNPLLKAGLTLPSALLNTMKDFRGVNQRMHNKTFIIDGKAVITGGRNVADEYFDFNPTFNFRDRDVLLLGGVVTQVSSSFEQFWSHTLSVPVNRLLKPLAPGRAKKLWAQLHHYSCDPNHFWPQVHKRIARVPEGFSTLARNGRLAWVENAVFVSDDPGKNAGDKGLKGRGLSTNTLIDLVRKAKHSVVIQTPYLVTTELSQDLFAAASKRGVRVKIITNSLATTDNPAAFRGYQRERAKLLDAGVELFEFRPDAKMRRAIMTSSLIKTMDELPVFGIHAKTMVVDKRLLVVGTFNLDPRSAHLNTECIALIPHEGLAAQVLEVLNTEMKPENSWAVNKDFNPDSKASFGLRLKAWFSGLVPASVL
jgi:phosphatidylserine/phosphatidylglycerophosphate/cardiolipin synthase-like enzyme